jgi:hypothetical protein
MPAKATIADDMSIIGDPCMRFVRPRYGKFCVATESFLFRHIGWLAAELHSLHLR